MSSLHQSTPFTGFQRLCALLSDEREDFLLLIAYTLVIGLLSLVVPLTAQALVNTIAAGILIQPLVILTLLLLGGLLFVGVLRTLQLVLVELLQRRIFSRIALKLAYHLPRILLLRQQGVYAPELVNRFFDTLTIQKASAKLFLDVPTAVFQILIGLALMGIYSPMFLVFDLLFIGAVLLMFALGRNGVTTSYEESTQKYNVAGWLEDIARCQLTLKMNGLPKIIQERTDELVVDYLHKRQKHFDILMRQSVWNFIIQAVATAGILALGGWLVIQRQLSLGQLVAAELVMVSILGALDKISQEIYLFYDLLTGLSKVGVITDLSIERHDGLMLPEYKGGAKIQCNQLTFAYPGRPEVLKGINLSIESGQRISLVGRNGEGKTTLAYLLSGLYEPTRGIVSMNDHDLRSLNLTDLRQNIALITESSAIFEGTIEENILLSRSNVTASQLQWALKIALLEDELARFPLGIKTPLVSEGLNISLGQRQRIILARAILEKPQLLILDEAFTGIDQYSKLQIMNNLFSPDNGWTILDISHDMHVVLRCEYVYVLAEGQIREHGSIFSLARKPDSALYELFPELEFFLFK